MVDMELDKAKKLQLDGCAILDCDNVKNLDFKDMDGEIDFILSPIDMDLEVDDLVDMDEGMCEILDREDEDSAVILEENQYDLVMGSII